MAVALAFSAAVLSGCTQSNIVSPTSGLVEGDGQPDLDVDKNITIDWSEVREDLRDTFLEPYGVFADYVMDLDVRYNDSNGVLTVVLPVSKKTTSDIAAVYGEEVLKVVGTSVSEQNFYYEAPDEESDELYYGSFFDEHDVCVQAFHYDEEDNEEAYLVNDTIKAGEHRMLRPAEN
jgi:hypothetical protein